MQSTLQKRRDYETAIYDALFACKGTMAGVQRRRIYHACTGSSSALKPTMRLEVFRFSEDEGEYVQLLLRELLQGDIQIPYT
ncbi:hypothetical protein TNCT_422021 [Trichonephila clavata]|uniref:Uncharacterized protein n=1 Tax=Trichonephila clavata TaxID=2740835 RepID=A0A8X6KZC6_TRICU|nr:hypothetical protein TNCT_422021 [Trichonephila clavata]